MDIYYQSATNRIIDFKSSTYRLQTADIFDYEWDFESIQSVLGGTITRFTKKMAKITERRFSCRNDIGGIPKDLLLLKILQKNLLKNKSNKN